MTKDSHEITFSLQRLYYYFPIVKEDLDLTMIILTFHSVSQTDLVPQLNIPKKTMKGPKKKKRLGKDIMDHRKIYLGWYSLNGQQWQQMEQVQKHSKIPTRLPLKCS